MINHLLRVTEKERSHVCTIDEQRKSPVEKVGTPLRKGHSRFCI
jgi:hypothetical protein